MYEFHLFLTSLYCIRTIKIFDTSIKIVPNNKKNNLNKKKKTKNRFTVHNSTYF